MVSQDKFKILVKGMKATYTSPEFIPDRDSYIVWYQMLKDLDYETLEAAIQLVMQTSPFPPTIADIRGAAAKIRPHSEDLTDMEAWALVKKALRNSGYNSEDEFEKLPETVRKTVGSPRTLAAWSQLGSDVVDSVEQSHFLRAYRAVASREKELDQLAPKIRRLIEGSAAPGLPEEPERQGLPDPGCQTAAE